MPILIDKDARITLLLCDVSVGIVTLKERTLSLTAQLFNEGCQELTKQLPR